MIIRPLGIAEVKLVIPEFYRDGRGFFFETWRRSALAEAGIDAEFVQENHSLSVAKGTVRGLHFQTPPHAQGKLVRVVRGSIFDVAVDIRAGSPSFAKYTHAMLSAENGWQMWIPPGFAHGFCTLEPDTEVIYKVTAYFAPEHDRGVKWDDPALGVDWPVAREAATLSDKDLRLPVLAELPATFAYPT